MPDGAVLARGRCLEFEVLIENLVPRQALLVKLVHKVVGIKLLDVPYARTIPFA